MKKIITMSGINFSHMCKALRDFTAHQLMHRPNAEKLDLKIDKEKMSVFAYANNNYMLGEYAASCRDMEETTITHFFIQIPPIMPSNGETVTFLSDENQDQLTIIVEYVSAGIMFRTTTKMKAEETFDNESYLANVVSQPSAIVAVNAQYMKRALQSLINSNEEVRRGKAPVFLAFSGEVNPIRIFAESHDQRLVLPTRNSKFLGKINMGTVSQQSIEMEVVKEGGVSFCPACKHDLKFVDRMTTDRDKVKICPFCGQHLDFSNK